MTRRLRLSLVAGALLVAIAAGALLLPAVPSARAKTLAEQRTVMMGAGEMPGISVTAFLPETPVEINAGDTVTWQNSWFEPHTVTFLGGTPPPNPESPQALAPSSSDPIPSYTSGFLNSGFEFKDTSFTVAFPNPGTYHYLCLLHPDMEGDVVVKPAGEPITSQAQLDAIAQLQLQAYLANARSTLAELLAQPVVSTVNGDGTRTFHVTVAADLPKTDFMQFFPANLQLNVGDTVAWETTHDAPHTVTFLGGQPLPIPPAPFNPVVSTPAPPSGPYSGGFINSGIIGDGSPVKTFSVTFGAAGTFEYLCILHQDQGMKGTITVGAAGGGAAPISGVITPPSTGTGPGGGSPLPLYALALTAAGALALAGGVGLRRLLRVRA